MKSTERMANLVNEAANRIYTAHGVKTRAEFALMIENETGIEKLAQATEALIRRAEWIGLDHGAIAQAHAAVQYYRGDTDDAAG